MVATWGPKRWPNVIAGALLLLLAAWSYRLYNQVVDQEYASLASVPQLPISDFKRIYNKSVAVEDDRMGGFDRRQEGSEYSLYIIDVRSPALYSAGHISWAI